jgi:uncharacterized protein YndB with AHSA1/START domain
MPRTSRTRVIAAPPARVWELVADPHHLPRWWPLTVRVEDVREMPHGRRSQWTKVMRTGRGATVRADFRCIGSTEGRRFAWEQELAGTPFERILKEARVEIVLEPAEGGTKVTVTSDEKLRGLSRLGATMMRSAARRRHDEALGGLERALVGDREGEEAAP